MDPNTPAFIPKNKTSGNNGLIKPDDYIHIINKLNKELSDRDNLIGQKLKEITYWKSQYHSSIGRNNSLYKSINYHKTEIEKMQKYINDLNIEYNFIKSQIRINLKLPIFIIEI